MIELSNPAIVAGVIGAMGAILAAVIGAAGAIAVSIVQARASERAARIRAGEPPEADEAAGDPAPTPPSLPARTARRRMALWAYVTAVALAGLTVLAWFYRSLAENAAPGTGQKLIELWTSPVTWDDTPLAVLIVWFFLTLAFSLVPRALPKGGGKTSVTWVFDFSAILLFGPAGAAVICGTSNILSNLRRGVVRPAFNFFQVVLTVAASAGVYRAAGGAFGEGVRVDEPAAVFAIALAGITYFVINSCLVAGVLALDGRISYAHAWRRNFERQVPEVFMVLLPVGTLLALAQVKFGYAGTLVVLPFVIQMHRAYEGRLTNAKARIRMLRTVANGIDRSNRRTTDHSLRIASYAVRVGWEMGVSAKEAEAIEAAALLHNLGTLAMRRILTKNEELNEHEQERMKRHPEIAYDMLRFVPDLADAARILHLHQERPDGKGYPQGIAYGIPLGAKILAAVDAFDAMINPRPYPRKKMGFPEAYTELRRGVEQGQFWESVAETVIRLHEQGRLDEELQSVLDEMARADRHPEDAATNGARRRAKRDDALSPERAKGARVDARAGQSIRKRDQRRD